MSHTIHQILLDFTQACLRKQVEPPVSLFQVDVLPEHGSWTVHFLPDAGIRVEQGPDANAAFCVRVDIEALRRLHAGTLSPVTAMGRARSSDPAPLDIVPGSQVKLVPGSDAFHKTLEFLQRFFNPSLPERILMGEEYSRMVHGGHVVGLFYGKGFRSAWYSLKQGERINDPQDTNPFPQAFVFLSGSGFAQIGDQTLEVKAGEAYHIPPGSIHMFWNENDEPLELLFLAWGDGA